MPETIDTIMRRRSCRKFQDREVEPEKLERILRAAMQSPTGHDARDWEFVIVKDAETRLAVSEVSKFSMCAKNAPLNVIVCANLEKAWQATPLWQCDMGAVCQSILLAAEAEGLGAVWLGVWPVEARAEYLRKLLNAPDTVVPYAVIPVGYKEREKEFEDRFDVSKIHLERY